MSDLWEGTREEVDGREVFHRFLALLLHRVVLSPQARLFQEAYTRVAGMV
jgi:hypothetical protein